MPEVPDMHACNIHMHTDTLRHKTLTTTVKQRPAGQLLRHRLSGRENCPPPPGTLLLALCLSSQVSLSRCQPSPSSSLLVDGRSLRTVSLQPLSMGMGLEEQELWRMEFRFHIEYHEVPHRKQGIRAPAVILSTAPHFSCIPS